jgi:hypothetical protein
MSHTQRTVQCAIGTGTGTECLDAIDVSTGTGIIRFLSQDNQGNALGTDPEVGTGCR